MSRKDEFIAIRTANGAHPLDAENEWRQHHIHNPATFSRVVTSSNYYDTGVTVWLGARYAESVIVTIGGVSFTVTRRELLELAVDAINWHAENPE